MTKLLLQSVPEPKTVKNGVHLDIMTPGTEEEANRLETLGARRIERGLATEDGFNGLSWPTPRATSSA